MGKSPPLPISFPLTFSLSPIVPLCTPPPFLPAMEVSRCDPSFLILPSPSSNLSLFLPFSYHFSLSKPHSLSLPLIEVVVQSGLLGHRRWARARALRLELVDGGRSSSLCRETPLFAVEEARGGLWRRWSSNAGQGLFLMVIFDAIMFSTT